MGRQKARTGDHVAILQGCNVPVILRAKPQGGWTVVGDAVVYGAMNAQMMHLDNCEYIQIY